MAVATLLDTLLRYCAGFQAMSPAMARKSATARPARIRSGAPALGAQMLLGGPNTQIGWLISEQAPRAIDAAIGVSALIRMTYHLYQGPLGAITVMTFGLLLTGFYWRYRTLWPVISAHIITDFAALI